MISERTVRAQIRRLQGQIDKLPPRSSDQAYGATEALRWVIGAGPPIRSLEIGMGK